MQVLFLLLPLLLSIIGNIEAYNITKILAGHPEFSTFNHYLTATHLASDIERRLTITILAVDNAGMSSLVDKHLSLPTMKNVLSLHCLVDYYGAKKLHQLTGGTALSSSFFQATGAAPGTTGFVNITDHRAGHVTFKAVDDGITPVTFVKSVKELPYNISIVQISAALSSPEAEAPAAAPAPVNLTASMSRSGCKLFSDLLTSTSVLATYESNIESGLTVFCPTDSAVTSFSPKFKNLTSPEQITLLLYHAEAAFNSMQQLKTENGASTTLATEGTSKRKKYTYTIQDDGDNVKVETKVVTAKIVKMILNEDPVAIYSIDKVLQPRELFAPAPAVPKKKKKGTKSDEDPSSDDDESADSPDSLPADEKAADENAATGTAFAGFFWAVAVVAAIMV